MNRDLPPLLFSGERLDEYLSRRERAMRQEIDLQSDSYILNISVDDYVEYLVEQFRVSVPSLRLDDVLASHEEVDIDISQNPRYGAYGMGRSVYKKGLAVTYHLPFDGDAELFRYQARTFSFNPPRARIGSSELLVRYEQPDPNADEIRRQWESDCGNVASHLEWTIRDGEEFNVALHQNARQTVIQRREKVLRDQNLLAALGVPIKRRDDAPATYSVPSVRRKPAIAKPTAATSAFQPEPTLADAEYDRILEIISNMSMVLERSPSAFVHMGEEALRDHFLVQLNGQYEGRATSETFNFDGKTDILIREDGRTIFIGECKFWKGARQFSETIDQILGYTSWRDTKTAILLFNRNKRLSAVLEQIPGVVMAHPNFKRDLGSRGETGFRYRLHHRDDPNRELTMAVLVFDVPLASTDIERDAA